MNDFEVKRNYALKKIQIPHYHTYLDIIISGKVNIVGRVYGRWQKFLVDLKKVNSCLPLYIFLMYFISTVAFKFSFSQF